MSAVEVARAFFLRDVRTELTYRSGLVAQVAAALLTAVILYFVGLSFRRVTGSFLDEYGGSYFAYAALGVALAAYMSFGLSWFADHLRAGQTSGSLELVLLAPVRLRLLLLAASLPGFVLGTAGLVASFAALVALGVDFDADLAAAAAALALAVVSFVGLGLLAAALVFVTRRGNPVSWGIRAISIVFAGVFFPVDQLPAPLWALAQALPLTHALELLRRSLLVGEGFGELWPTFAVLGGLTIALLAGGLALCSLAVRVARTDGTLTH